MAEEFGEKTEAPTQKKKKDAADEGQILKSREFATALLVLVGCGWMALAGPSLLHACQGLMAASFRFDSGDIADFEPFRPLAQAGWRLLPSLATLFAVVMLAGIASQAGLSGIRFNSKLLEPKGNRINPASGIKRMFGMQGLTELGKSLLKVTLLGVIGAYMLWQVSKPSFGLAATDIHEAIAVLGDRMMAILFAMAGGLVIIAGIDLPIQIVRLLGQLRMSKQEIRDEHKEQEGSPEVKQQQRQRQREAARRSVRKSVETAHVVLTNPTHFAVALRYDRGQDKIPVVVAKGRGATALAIRDVAGDAKVPVLEYPALARALYFTSRENQEIRDDLYMAIATVLAFVFNLNAQAGGSPPPIDVPDTALFDENGVKR